MSKSEIVQKVADVHNILINIPVSGDNVIAMATALVEMRQMVKDLQDDVKADAAEKDEAEEM